MVEDQLVDVMKKKAVLELTRVLKLKEEDHQISLASSWRIFVSIQLFLIKKIIHTYS